MKTHDWKVAWKACPQPDGIDRLRQAVQLLLLLHRATVPPRLEAVHPPILGEDVESTNRQESARNEHEFSTPDQEQTMAPCQGG
jgi:hypothetical protein